MISHANDHLFLTIKREIAVFEKRHSKFCACYDSFLRKKGFSPYNKLVVDQSSIFPDFINRFSSVIIDFNDVSVH